MLRDSKNFHNYKLKTAEGEIGKIKSFLFDDQDWKVRYFVISTGGWLAERKVLVKTSSLKNFNTDEKVVDVDLTKEQIKNSPEIDVDKPVSRQHEMELHQYYGWTPYWGPIQTHGIGVAPPAPVVSENVREDLAQASKGDPHLRNSSEVEGYSIKATDAKIGHVEEFVIEDETYRVRYLVIDTKDFLPGKKVLVAPEWIESVVWESSDVVVNLTEEQIKNAPEYNHNNPLTKEYEEKLYNHYGHKKYWETK